MPFAETQSRQLAGKLLQRHVKTREQQGMTLSYIEGWHVIAEANRIFGFDGWDREMIWSECVWQDARSANKACAYAARVRIRVRAGDTVVFRDGSGVGHGSGATLGEAHESALKEAETDATKCALTTFGNLFGLALYDKEQTGVRRTRERHHGPLATWVLYDPDGEIVRTHEKPQDFCRCFKESIAAAPTPEALRNLWQRNTEALKRLRVSFADLERDRFRLKRSLSWRDNWRIPVV
jgi:DNA recombination protein Rad52